MNTKEIIERLKDRFPERNIQWRVQRCGISKNNKPWVMVIPYLDSRAIQERLDNTVGCFNWKDSYKETADGFICSLSIRINNEWITKQNGANYTNIEKVKGGISDSFKRVASSGFGIGRYLYEENERFAECSANLKDLKLENGQAYETAKTKDKKYIYWIKPKIEPIIDKVKKYNEKNKKISEIEIELLKIIIEQSNTDKKKFEKHIFENYGWNKIEELYVDDYKEMMEILLKKLNKVKIENFKKELENNSKEYEIKKEAIEEIKEDIKKKYQ
jgi:hypothetical protein